MANRRAKQPLLHPKYSEMVIAAVGNLKERTGSSRQAILKYICANFEVHKDERIVNQHLKVSLRSCVTKELLSQSKGTGASGSFRLGEKAKQLEKAKVVKPKTDKVAKKPAAGKAKPVAKKPTKATTQTKPKAAANSKAAKASTSKTKAVTKPKTAKAQTKNDVKPKTPRKAQKPAPKKNAKKTTKK